MKPAIIQSITALINGLGQSRPAQIMFQLNFEFSLGSTMQQCDPYNLQRFVDAQNSVFEQVCSELRAGKFHWMWFIFPLIEGLGTSQASRYFAISSKEEAEAYVNHPILGPRLRECSRLVISSMDARFDQISLAVLTTPNLNPL
jgi:hypothetical protein